MSASESATPDSASLILLLWQTRHILACHRELGIGVYPATPKLREFGKISPLQQAPPSPTLPTQQAEPAHEQIPALSLPEITRQLVACRRCSLASAPVLGQGSATPRLMVVKEIPSQNLAADELFWRMMAAIGLNQETIYVTNMVKCRQHEMRDAERNCLYWLEQELRLLQPRLICAMGDTAAKLLIGKNAPLLRLRGKLHPCHLSAAPQAQVIATYAPQFLLQQPEMKKAAWEDLQKAQRYLSFF